MHNHMCDPFLYSDHHIVSLKLQLGHSNPRGRGVWKFNRRLLKSEDFCAAMNDFWPLWQRLFTDPHVWWDAGKLQL